MTPPIIGRSHRGPRAKLGGRCPHEVDAVVGGALRACCGRVLVETASVIEARVAKLLAAVSAELPQLHGRLKIGADVTLRRTVQGQHGDDVVPSKQKKEGGGGDGGANSRHASTTTVTKPRPRAAVHCDSWDGSILCFGLCSTKLGTPVYPDATFPSSPVKLFVQQ